MISTKISINRNLLDKYIQYYKNPPAREIFESIRDGVSFESIKTTWSLLEDNYKKSVINHIIQIGDLEHLEYIYAIEPSCFTNETTNNALSNIDILKWLCSKNIPINVKAAQNSIRFNNIETFKIAIKYSEADPIITRMIGDHSIQGPGKLPDEKFPYNYEFFVISNLNNIPWHPMPYPNINGYRKSTIYVPLVYELCKYIDYLNKSTLGILDDTFSMCDNYDNNILSIVGGYMSQPNTNVVPNHPQVTPLRK